MSRITTEYKGMTISFSENEDKWSCIELGYSNASLAKTKARIDKHLRDQRKGQSVQCLYLGDGYSSNMKPVVAEIIEYLPNKRIPSYAKSLGPQVAAMIASNGMLDKPTRNEKGLGAFAFDTPEVRAVMEQAREKREQARLLVKEAEDMVQAIPRLTVDDIAGLVEIARQMETEKED